MTAEEEVGITFEVNLASDEEARQIGDVVRQVGGETEERPQAGVLPLAVLLAIAVPPGLAMLALVIDRIVQGWRRAGVIIDARGDGPPRLLKETDLPYGSVVILTRNGDEVHRSDLPDPQVGTYIAAALQGISGGSSAADSDAAAIRAVSA